MVRGSIAVVTKSGYGQAQACPTVVLDHLLSAFMQCVPISAVQLSVRFPLLPPSVMLSVASSRKIMKL